MQTRPRSPLPPDTKWSTALLPTLASLEPLRRHLQPETADAILLPEVPVTAFEATLQS